MATLASPALSLQRFGHVMGMEYDEPIRYDPFAITAHLQETILSYVSNPPIGDNGSTDWLVVLKSRQGGSSTTAAMAFYTKAHYQEGWEHLTLADNKDRADYLFERVMFNHNRWPEELKLQQVNSAETRQLSWKHGGKMRVGSGRTSGVGVGRGTSSLHASELPLWLDAPTQFNQIFPSMFRRKRALMMLESTPFPMDRPSSEWYRDLCQSAATGKGRLRYAFFPFWDSKLNVEAWPEGSPMDTEELRLMEQYNHLGLRPKHLAFRRYLMDTDPEIRRAPELFGTYFPFDDISCWLQSGKSVIRWEHISCAVQGTLRPWGRFEEYHEFHQPREGARYVIGVDPSGHGTRDHAAFQVLEIWREDWRQVAVFASDAEPDEVATKLHQVGMKYNRASICVERNGVGTAITTALKLMHYPNIWMDQNLRPGFHKQSDEKLVGLTIDALRTCLRLEDKDTVSQLKGYQNDRSVQQSEKAVLLSRSNHGRRGRHHWDKVSALMMAIVGARTMPQHSAPADPTVVIPMPGLTLADIDRMAVAQRQGRKTRSDKGRRARYNKRRRR